ncbi:hypothetical protein [Soonwooa sp.]|uniref:hypothetical protein n=1 Tax=Soonwooa sp. TaxID=1938592 RepID=UPI0026057FFF|nr:hypothetical protein [Soonwooa sp.]
MKISIPKPCHENWDQMTPAEKGKFCGICSKNVTDLTAMSDDQILNELQSNSNICVIANDSQLNRNLEYSFINSLFSKFALGVMLTSAGIVSINAQQKGNQQSTKGEVTHISSSNDTNNVRVMGKIAMPPKKDTVKMPIRLGTMAVNPDKTKANPIYVLDGIIVDEKKIKDLKPANIKKVEVLKKNKATDLYGEKAKDGVIIITSKKKKQKFL